MTLLLNVLKLAVVLFLIGIVPFLIGTILQLCDRRKKVSSGVVWTTAFAMVLLQKLTTGKTLINSCGAGAWCSWWLALADRVLCFFLSVLLIAFLMTLGAKFVWRLRYRDDKEAA